MKTQRIVAVDELLNLSIRHAEIGDVKNVLEAQLAAFPDDPTNLDEAKIRKSVTNKENRLLIAMYGSQFAGYAICTNRPYRPWTSLDNLIVLPQYARKGVGLRLMHEVMKPFQCRPIMRLFVERNNFRAVNLYKKLGFIHVQTKRNNYENNDDALIMYKFL